MNSLPEDVAVAAQELLDAQLIREFEATTFTAPRPMSAAELGASMADIEAGKQRIFCHPADFERISTTVYGAGFGLYYRVEASPVAEPGQMILAASQREFDDLLHRQTW